MRAWTIIAGLLLAAAAHADDYREPRGFNGHPWGETFADFHNLILWRAGTATDAPGKVEDFRLECVADPADPSNTCSAAYSRTYQQVQGEGSHALGEYYFHYDRNPWQAQGIDLATISYLFCAHGTGHLPRPLRKNLKLCGARVMFRSDRPEELAKRPDGYESNFDRLLHALVAEHGAPPGYELRGQITIETDEQRLVGPEGRKPHYLLYRWCGLSESDRRLVPPCEATITLSFEATSGFGTLLYATGPVYAFAEARHVMKDENNDLYVLLRSLKPDVPYRPVKHECTGSHICSPTVTPMSARQLGEFQP
jgi:hypothetical protein